MTFTDDQKQQILSKLSGIAEVRNTLLKFAGAIPGFADAIRTATGWLDQFNSAGGSFTVGDTQSEISFKLKDGSVVTFIVGNDILTATEPLLAVDYQPNPVSLADAFENTPFAGLTPTSSEVVISTQGVTSVGQVDVDSGISLISEFDVAHSSNPFLSFLHKTLGINTVDAIATVASDHQSLTGAVQVKKGFSIPIGISDPFGVTFNNLNFSISSQNGKLPVFSGSEVVTFKGYDPTQKGEPDLVLSTGFKVDASSSLSLFAEVDASKSGTWVNPFGFAGAKFTTLAVQAGVSGLPPYIDNFGVFADLKWQGNAYTLGFNVDIHEPANDAFVLTVNEPVNLARLWTQMSAATLGPSLSTLFKVASPLFKYIPFTAMSATSADGASLVPLFKFAPIGATIANQVIAPGFALSADVDLAGETGSFALEAKPNSAGLLTELQGDLSIKELKLGNYLSISGAEGGDLKAHLDASADTQNFDFSGSGKIAVFGFTLGKADFDISAKANFGSDVPAVNAHVAKSFLDLGIAKFNIDHLDIVLGASSPQASGAADISLLGNTLSQVDFTFNAQQIDFKLATRALNLGNVVQLTGDFHFNEKTFGLTADAGVKIVGINQNIANGKLVAGADGSVTVTGDLGFNVKGVGVGTKLTVNYDSQNKTASLRVDADVLGLSHLSFGFAINGQNLENAINDALSNAIVGNIGQQAAWVADAVDKGFTSVFNAGNFNYAASQVDNFVKNAGSAFVNDITSLFGNKKEHNQTILGSDKSDGRDGNKALEGNGGNDIIFGYGGDDVLIGHQGNDMMDGGSGTDYLYGGSGNDILNGGDGSDVVAGDSGSDKLYGGSGDDELHGDAQNNADTGQDGNDELHGGTGNDRLYGNGGDDVLYGDDGNDSLDGGSGTNTLYGGAGNDFLTNSGGSGALYGGSGDDYYLVQGGESVSEYANEGVDTVETNRNYTLGANVENLILNENAVFVITPGKFPGYTLVKAINGSGNELDNRLIGNSENNTLDGGAGKDYIDGGGGADTMIGGDGNDTFVVDNAGDSVVEVADFVTAAYRTPAHYERIDGGIANGGQRILIPAVDHPAVPHIGGIDTVVSSIDYKLGANVEHLTLTGTANLNGQGNELDNVLIGNSGKNILIGNAGNDTLDGGGGADYLEGDAGNDTYVVDNAGDIVRETSTDPNEIDTVRSSISFSLTDVDTGTFTLAVKNNIENLVLTGTADINGTGNALNNTLTGNDGNNLLDGSIGADTMIGGLGNDTYIVDNAGDLVTEAPAANSANDYVQAALGNTTLAPQFDEVKTTLDSYTLGANVERLTLEGTAKTGIGNELDNVLTGNGLNNRLEGGAGNDKLIGGAGDDTMIGGTGNDLYVVDSAGDVVIEGLGVSSGIDMVISSIDYTLGANVEILQLADKSAALKGTGNALNNTLIGNSADNLLTGGAGDDLLDGGAGLDTLIGGTGDDRYVVDNTGDIVIENAGEGIDSVSSSVTYTLTANVENLTLTGTAAINGTGNELGNILIGNSAANTLMGGAGDDTLDGGAGADILIGGTGNDTYVVDNAGDKVIETSTDANEIDTVLSAISYDLSTPDHANLENVTLTGTVNATRTQGPKQAPKPGSSATGNDHDNLLIGNIDDNTLSGGAGNDTLDGGAGADILIGGTGNDIYVVDNAGDQVKETSTLATEIDTVKSSVNWTLGANVENLTLTGTAAINGFGNALDNVLIGNDGANILYGGGGNDTLTGGGGADIFAFAESGDGVDTITDFSAGDSIRNTGANLARYTFTDAPGALSKGLIIVTNDGTQTVLTLDTRAEGTVNPWKVVLQGVYTAAAFKISGSGISLVGGTPNQAPSGASATLAVLEDDTHVFQVSDFGFADASQAPPNALKAVLISSLPAAGSLTLDGEPVTLGQAISAADIGKGLLAYAPADNASGSNYARIGFQVQDDGGTANGGVDTDPSAATLTFNVTGVNDAPQGQDHTLTVQQGEQVSLALADFGFTDANDTPANSFSAVLIGTLPEAGALTLAGVDVAAGQLISAADIAAGQLQFAPAAGGSGSGYAQFNFQVRDDGGTANGGKNTDTTPRKLTFDVPAGNTAPVDRGQALLQPGTEDTPYTLSKAALLADFFDAQGDTLALTDLSASIGSLVDNGDGTVTFRAPGNFNGGVNLAFNVDDGHGGVTAGSRILVLSDVNDAALITGTANANVDETNAPITVGGTLSITDIDSAETFQAQAGTAGKYGVFTLDTTGTWAYTAKLAYDYLNPGDSLTDSFQVFSADGTASSVTVTINGTAEMGTVHLGDAPVRQSGTGGQWAQAWTQTGFSIQHKADHTNASEAWSAATLNAVSSQLLSGGDIYSGNLGVSGQSAVTNTVKQEIDGKEALRIVVPTTADSVTLKLAGLFLHDDGGTLNESGLLRLLDANGNLVAEQLFVADSLDGSKTVTVSAPGFHSIELVAGAYDAAGHFVYGAYSNDAGAYGAPISNDAAGKPHGSDFMLHSVNFTVPLVGVPASGASAGGVFTPS